MLTPPTPPALREAVSQDLQKVIDLINTLPPADRVRVMQNQRYWYLVAGYHWLSLAHKNFAQLQAAVVTQGVSTKGDDAANVLTDLLNQISHAQAIAFMAIEDEYPRERGDEPLALSLQVDAAEASTPSLRPAPPAKPNLSDHSDAL